MRKVIKNSIVKVKKQTAETRIRKEKYRIETQNT